MPRIGDQFVDLSKINPEQLNNMPGDAFRYALEQLLRLDAQDRREMQLLRYEPPNPRTKSIFKSRARLVGIGGGNGSGKTTTAIVKALALATGVIPDSVRDDLRPQFRGPINVRIIVQSLTTVLEQIILPKMMWWKWTGVDLPGGERGHWGWIPKMCLVDASWDRSWSKKHLTLHVLCRNPDNLDEVMGQSMIHFMSHEQNAADAASGDFHIIVMDEPPKLAMFRESQARTMRVNGQVLLAMTWPDDPTIPVDWIFDEIYEPGQPGPNKNPDIDWFELWTEENTTLDQRSVAEQAKKWSEDTKNVRLYGRPIRFSNRVHPGFTDIPMTWSHAAGKNVFPIDGKCPETGSSDLVEYCHVEEFDIKPRWPTVFVIDPHPRKPHMFLWAQIDPSDDIYVCAEGAIDADPVGTRMMVEDQERFYGMSVIAQRLIDPNMGNSPSSSDREKTWQSEFYAAGLACDLADDTDVGRKLINEYLKVDRRTNRPRLVIHPRCQQTVYQMKRYVWDNYRRADERDLKQTPRDKYDDYPTMLKYLLNSQPAFKALTGGGGVSRMMNSPFRSAVKPKRRGDVIYRDDRP
ncbi:MAG: hypothetical protein E6Q97_32660 [Desulfurellales bacterium]|nr:MAG: hypothetical protein E6Q97_32660 [Desulfurellales bacterium]